VTRYAAFLIDDLMPSRVSDVPFGCYEIDSLPSQVGVAICHGLEVFPEHRGRGLGHELKRWQMGTLRELGYRFAQCTVVADNEAQIKVLLAAGWFRMGGFFSTRQGRSVEIYGWEVTK
jgi:GNAT superfamily N-acetyltransferase